MTGPTTYQVLAEALLGCPVDGWITERRQSGHSYRKIAEELATATDGKVRVAAETLRLWARDYEVAP